MATLGKGRESNVSYLSVTNGKLVQRLSEDSNVPGAVEREITFGPNTGKMVKELQFSNVEGYITNLEIKTNEYEGNTITSLNISIDDNVQVQFNEKQMATVTNTLLNVDFAQPIKISVYLKKDKNAFSFEQNGEWTPWAVTRATPLDCPQPTKKTVKGVEKWNFDDYEEWFYSKLEGIIADNFANGRTATPDGAKYNVESSKIVKTTTEEEISIEDIPF